MPHDKIKDAASRRMAETGEPYSVARRAVIREHEAGCCCYCGAWQRDGKWVHR